MSLSSTVPTTAAAVTLASALLAASAMTWTGGVRADVVRVPPPRQAASVPAAPFPARIPERGATMAQVRKAFGKPSREHPTVGGHMPRHPPITRWDYPRFSVFFEHDIVIDTVIPGHPPKVYHTGQLQHGP